MKSPTPLKNILSTRPATRRLIQRANNLLVLNKRLSKLLPEPIAQHCKIAAVEQGKLIILASSSAWATRLRLHQTTIIKGFQDTDILSIVIQIKPAAIHHNPATRQQPAIMSRKTSNLLIGLAETITDPKLKLALQRLSERTHKQP